MISKILVAAIIAFIASTITLSSFASAATANGTPFDQLRAAIQNLQNQINNIQLTPGPQGPKGDTGATGATGPAGPQGVPGLGNIVTEMHIGNLIQVPPGVALTSEAFCPVGMQATGGGFSVSDDFRIKVVASFPRSHIGEHATTFDGASPLNGWRVDGKNEGTSPSYLQAWVACAAPAP